MSRPIHVVIMGVSGCGKSVVGRRIAQLLDQKLIEGDAFHPQSNIDKMARGEPLDDADRAGWLQALAEELKRRPQGAVLACSALKKKYRDTLRAATPDLTFIHLSITPEESRRRVASRPGHFYPASLVGSQFEALEDPAGEPGVLVVDGTLPIDTIAHRSVDWLRARASA